MAQDGYLLPSRIGASHPPMRHDPPDGAQMEWLLLVEHNRLFGEGLVLLLEWRTGLSSVRAASLAGAKGILEEADQEPACIIVDLDLPDGEANELLNQPDGIPLLGLIEGRNLYRQAEALGLGADEVLRKGSVEKIGAAVQRLIDPRSITAF
jgi:DNA-binding NarL/FixJ family response regulator